jgi:hypothetical protein
MFPIHIIIDDIVTHDSIPYHSVMMMVMMTLCDNQQMLDHPEIDAKRGCVNFGCVRLD